jgi:hypothetical protein
MTCTRRRDVNSMAAIVVSEGCFTDSAVCNNQEEFEQPVKIHIQEDGRLKQRRHQAGRHTTRRYSTW